MNKYRIIEKKGTYDIKYRHYVHPDKPPTITNEISSKTYIPRYIVQEYKQISNSKFVCPQDWAYVDLQEFSDLEEARKYKRNLELEDGIVIE